VQALLRTDSNPVRVKEKGMHALRQNVAHTHPVQIHKIVEQPNLMAAAKYSQPLQRTKALPVEAQYVTVREELVVMVTQQTPSGEQQGWQMQFVQISIKPQLKGKPNKT
jgi:deoxyribodipyrimidine photolyase-like uncharacterized protein